MDGSDVFEWCRWVATMKPTAEQISYAKLLLQRLGYDLNDYDFDEMDREEVSDLISELKEEWEGK